MEINSSRKCADEILIAFVSFYLFECNICICYVCLCVLVCLLYIFILSDSVFFVYMFHPVVYVNQIIIQVFVTFLKLFMQTMRELGRMSLDTIKLSL